MAPISSTKPRLPQVILTCDQCSTWLNGIEGAAKPVVIAEARQRGWHVATVFLYENGVRTDKTIEKVLCPRHARERARCGHAPNQHLVWKAQDGEVAICKMDDSHLVNALKFLVDNGRTDEDVYRQMYDEKLERRKECVDSPERLAILNSHWAPPPDRPSVRDLPPTPTLTVQRFDLVKELKDGEHVVVSRKADKGMVINIDEDTVKALYTVLQRIGGNPKTTSRGLTLALLSAMVDTIPQSEWEIPWAVYIDNDLHGSVYWV